jgi:hypothetical protein
MLSGNWCHCLDPSSNWGYSTSYWSFGGGFYQTFTPYMRGKQPTTSKMVNSDFCGAATSAGLAKNGEWWVVQENFYHKRGPGNLIMNPTTIQYPSQSTYVFRDESLYMVPIQSWVSSYHRCQHCCPSTCLSMSYVAALWFYHFVLKMHVNPMC